MLTIYGDIDDICTRQSTGNHTGSCDTGRVMRVDVDWEIGVSLPNCADEHLGSLGLEQTGHILDTEDMDTLFDELVDEVEVVLQGVLCPLWVCDVTGIADCAFDDTTGLLGCIDTEFEVIEIVERAGMPVQLCGCSRVSSQLTRKYGRCPDRLQQLSLRTRRWHYRYPDQLCMAFRQE